MKNITDAQYALFDNFIDTHDNFIIVGHKEPDGDCIASSLVLASIIKKIGKPHTLMSAGPFKRSESKKYESLFTREYKPLSSNPAKTGLFIVDCSEIFRLGDDIEKHVKNLDYFVIDHHKTANVENTQGIIDSSSPATACLIQQLYEHRLGEVSEEDAKLLFFGISTDTGFFRFLDNTSENIFCAAGRLVRAGADPRTIYENMQSGKPLSSRKLLSIALERAKQYYDGKLIITYETMDDTHRYGREGRDTDALYQILLATEQVQAVAFLRQENELHCTAGFRSKYDIDVSAIAAVFGGGGHRNAAGLSTEDRLDTFLPKVLAEFSKIF